MSVLGIDIGGANIKLADPDGFAASRPFALWREPQQLGPTLAECLERAPAHAAIAATTTGELADCFETKRDGIREIYSALAHAARGRAVFVYLTDGRFVAPEEAIALPHLAAASNWHALARFAGRFAPVGNGLLIDIGSTTTDIIPLTDGQPHAEGSTDTERLLAGELVYTGVTRTPIAALAATLPWRGQKCPIARELFATTLDAHLLVGNLPEDPQDRQTADGRAATRAAAHARLARMLAADRESCDEADALAAAKTVIAAQLDLIGGQLNRVAQRFAEPCATYLISGQGEFLARQLIAGINRDARVISLAAQLGAHASQAAAAYAVAVLAAETVASGPPVRAAASLAP